MKILLISGGISSERRISLMSANQVKKALGVEGHLVKIFDLKKGYQQLKKISKSFNVIFPVIHGEEGEGGDLQKFLSTQGIPFVGGSWKGYKKAWYKIPFKKFADKNKIPTSTWKKVKSKEDIIKFGFPSVLKSSSGGSSREVVILKSKDSLKSYLVNKLLKSNLPLFVEKYLQGIEVTVAMLGNKSLPVVEIVPPDGEWFDYQNKYWGATKEIPHAPSLDEKTKKLVQEISEKIHKNFNLGQFSRTDFILSNGKVYVLEVNTIPGLTTSSLFPKAAAALGISFPKLLDKIVKMALKNGE